MKLKRLLIAGLLLVLVLFGGCLYFVAPHPPGETTLIRNFQDHRAAFEKLRDMLEVDSQLRRVAAWGVELGNPVYLGPAPGARFSADRYRQYLTLLKEANGLAAARNDGTNANPNILLWAWGWAGDTQHIGVCWRTEPPANLIGSIDGYHSPGNDPARHWAYCRIDQNWYLWTDR